MKKVLLTIGIAIIGGSILFFMKQSPHNPRQVCFQNQTCFVVEVAADTASHQKGLMFRESLERDKGMLFIFDVPGQYSFWMKDTFIPLDIIWVDANKKIVFIQERAEPCGETCPFIDPGVTAQYVLEINAGMVQEKGLKVGDLIFLR